jgi:hypothetical protein
MGKIESSIGQRTFESSGVRKYTVENAGEDAPMRMPEPETQITAEEIMAARQRKMQDMNRVSDSARRRIEMLIGIGRAKDDVQIQDDMGNVVTYSVRTLKSREIRHIVSLASELSRTKDVSSLQASHEIREKILSFALYSVDGVDIDVALNVFGASDEEKFAARAAFLEELDDSVVNFIYSRYEQLNKKNIDRFSVKTEEEAKEVAEQMKKSGEGARA